MGSTVLIATEAFMSSSFVHYHYRIDTKLKNNNNSGPPLHWGRQPPTNNNNEYDATSKNEKDKTLKANRWSKFAPDTSLPAEEFRNELKENMKRDLERRRAADPNRGNQPAKSYLDSL